MKFQVHLEDKPVLFLEIKRPQRIAYENAHGEADNQMRAHMPVLASTCLAFYTHNKQQNNILPTCMSPNHEVTTDIAPLDHWDSDILEDEGHQWFQDLVAEIIIGCNQL